MCAHTQLFWRLLKFYNSFVVVFVGVNVTKGTFWLWSRINSRLSTLLIRGTVFNYAFKVELCLSKACKRLSRWTWHEQYPKIVYLSACLFLGVQLNGGALKFVKIVHLPLNVSMLLIYIVVCTVFIISYTAFVYRDTSTILIHIIKYKQCWQQCGLRWMWDIIKDCHKKLSAVPNDSHLNAPTGV